MRAISSQQQHSFTRERDRETTHEKAATLRTMHLLTLEWQRAWCHARNYVSVVIFPRSSERARTRAIGGMRNCCTDYNKACRDWKVVNSVQGDNGDEIPRVNDTFVD